MNLIDVAQVTTKSVKDSQLVCALDQIIPIQIVFAYRANRRSYVRDSQVSATVNPLHRLQNHLIFRRGRQEPATGNRYLLAVLQDYLEEGAVFSKTPQAAIMDVQR